MLNVNFKGYTNIIAIDKVNINGFITSYLAMKVDDEGEKDLTRLRQLRNLQGYPPNFQNDDILTLIHITNNKSEDIFLSEKQMCLGEQLRSVQDNFVPNSLSETEYKKIENAHLKAYTILASITKRMMNDKFENEDSNISRVIKTINNNLLTIRKMDYPIFNIPEAFELTAIGYLKHFKFQSVAANFNKKIAQTMTVFFK